VVWEDYEEAILLEDEAKNAGIAPAMASIFNEVFRQKHPSEIAKLFRFGYIFAKTGFRPSETTRPKLNRIHH